MASLLNRFGIEFALVERSTSITDHPKARGCDIRTMELFRQWGIEEPVRARGLPDGADVFAFVDSVAGHEYGRTTPELPTGQSPTWKCTVSQDVVEDELCKLLQRARHGRIHYGTEFVSFHDGSEGIHATTRDLATGRVTEWRADYLIGADGAGSGVRRQAGIDMRGPSTLAVMANEYWLGDLSHIPRIGATGAYRIAPTTPDGVIPTVLNTNGRDRWLSAFQVGTQSDERPGSRKDEEVIAVARQHAGIPDLPVKVISRSIWRLSRQVAASYRRDHVFLVGDAAHRFPPNGGFGMNSGIQDAHNLAWKLRLVYDGHAGPGLLDTYDLERRPIAESNADFSLGNRSRFDQTDIAFRARNPDQLGFWIRDSDNHIHSSGQSLGYNYGEGALVPDGTVRPVHNPRYYAPSDRPGGRFPHFWTSLSRHASTLDWFDREFVLVAGPKADAWMSAGRQWVEKTGIPLQLQQLDTTHESDGLSMGPRGAVLVRPDGFVAFRCAWVPSDPAKELAGALDNILRRSLQP